MGGKGVKLQLRTVALIVVTAVIALLFIIMYGIARVTIVDGSGDLGSRVLTFLLLSFAIGLAVAFGAVFLIEKIGISQMYTMGEAMRRIREENDLSVRVPAAGTDEVSQFGATINETLDALEASRRQLEESEGKYRNLIESINDMVWETDERLRFTYISPRVRDILGYGPGDVVGRSPFDLAPKSEEARLVPLISGLIERQGTFSLVEMRVMRKDGTLADLEISGTPVKDPTGKIAGYRGIVRDMSERKRAEEALRESEERLRLCAATANFGTFDRDLEKDTHVWSPETYGIYGVPPGTPLTMEMVKRSFYPGDKPDSTLAAGLDPAGPGEFTMEFRIIRARDGEVRWVHERARVFFQGEGPERRAVRVLGAVQDVTERKQAEEKMKQINDELESRVQQRTAELEEANDSLESNVQQRTAELASAVKALQAEVAERNRVEQQMMSSLQEKEVLLKEIHHRVKNNLQIISSLLSLQTETVGREYAALFRESQDRIRSMALIHEKLYQSKSLSHIDYREYVRSLAAYLARSYVTGPGIGLAVDIDGIALDIDKAIPCGLIINELVSNSLKYAFPEGRQGDVRIALSRDGDGYTLVVADSGVGLPPGLDFRNTPSLGLQLVNTLVGQLEGTIELLPGAGTTFRITFGK
jgi:PAS domain S-box-containing protein